MSKRDAAVYLRAAERIAIGERTKFGCVHSCLHSCCMVEEEGGFAVSERYRTRFYPTGQSFGLLANGWYPNKQECRVLALCFAAAMAESGDL